jgi:hypothetical protein
VYLFLQRFNKRAMKSTISFLPFLLLTFLLLAGVPAEAQRSKTKKSSGVAEYLDDKGSFASRLWYGGGFNLGFSGNSYYNVFNLGVSPMVGYKVFEPFSVGPRVSLQYTYIRGVGTDGNIHKIHPLAYSVGVFARYKIFRSIFAQAEYEYESAELPYFNGPFLVYDIAQAQIATARINRDNAYLGVGYNSAVNGGFGYEILLLYNFLSTPNSIDLPIVIRFGFTYRY